MFDLLEQQGGYFDMIIGILVVGYDGCDRVLCDVVVITLNHQVDLSIYHNSLTIDVLLLQVLSTTP